jgi:hypothetical protein
MKGIKLAIILIFISCYLINLPARSRKILSFMGDEYSLYGKSYTSVYFPLKKDVSNTEEIPVEVTQTPKTLTVNANAYDKWVYVSFSQGKVVAVSNYKNDLSWDIAFHRTDIRLNGGASGKGKAAGLETNATDLNAVIQIPVSGYITDVMDNINVSMMGKEAAPKNLKLSNWVSKSGMPPVYTVSKKVYLVRTADGKHVKIKFLKYVNAENKGGHIQFTYVYMD